MKPDATRALLLLGALGSLMILDACGWNEKVILGRRAPPSGGDSSTGGELPEGGASSNGGNSAGQGGDDGVHLTAVLILSIAELNTERREDNPTLTADELLLCFTSKRPESTGGSDIWCAERPNLTEPFAQPSEQTQLNTDGFESSSALSLDGLTLWFGSDVNGDLDIFRSERPNRSAPWNAPERDPTLNSTADDIPRPPASNDRVMPLASRRDSDDYWTYFATRSSVDTEFGEPVLIEELAFDGRSVVDAFLREDGLLLLFTLTSADDPGDLYYAERTEPNGPFGPPIEIRGINTESDDRDPWLSADGRRLYFSSNRSDGFDLYVAELDWLP